MKQLMLGILLLLALSGCGVDWFPSTQPEITTPILPSGVVGQSYNQTIAATGGTTTLVWAIAEGVLPPGLSLSSSGVISGTPTKAGTFRFTVIAADSTTRLTGTHTYTVVILDATQLPSATVGTAYMASAATGTSWTLADTTLPTGVILPSNVTVGLPPGLTVGSTDITGTPITAGDFLFSLTVTDGATSATNMYTIHVDPAGGALSITTTSPLPDATTTTAYSQALAATGGTAPYTWSVSGTQQLPTGLSLSPAGVISGTASGPAGTTTFTVMVTDSSSPSLTATKSMSITVD